MPVSVCGCRVCSRVHACTLGVRVCLSLSVFVHVVVTAEHSPTDLNVISNMASESLPLRLCHVIHAGELSSGSTNSRDRRIDFQRGIFFD